MPRSLSSDNEVVYRAPRADDFRFIFDSWIRSWRDSPWAGVISNNRYFPITRDNIEQLVARGADFLIACHAEDPDVILGWICHEQAGPNAVVHYIYVKDPYLPFRLGEQLVDRIPGIKPGFYTYRYRQVVDSTGRGWRHAPEIARRREAHDGR